MNVAGLFHAGRRRTAGGRHGHGWWLIGLCATLCSCQALPDPAPPAGATRGQSISVASEVPRCAPGSYLPGIDIEHWRPDGIEGPWPPDEYLCDGGDAATRVVVSRQRQVSGLDPEDTVAHFDTLEGNTVVTPSNSVCLYAPRFAAVRKISEPLQEQLLEHSEWFEQPLTVQTNEAASGGADRPAT